MSKSTFKMEDSRQRDWVGKGFHKLDSKLITDRPPKINWGPQYREFTAEKKVEYLEKLAASMNHAAHLIQTERDNLLVLYDKKEEQIVRAQKAMSANVEMVNTAYTEMNEMKQGFNKIVAQKNREIEQLKKELEKWQ